VIGSVPISAADGAEVRVTVRVKNGVLVVVEVRIETRLQGASPSPATCVISGGRVDDGIELEGTKSSGTWDAFTMEVNGERGRTPVSVIVPSTATVRCIGGAKTESADACKTLLSQKQPKVHVRGTLTACDAAGASVTATEVKVQKD